MTQEDPNHLDLPHLNCPMEKQILMAIARFPQLGIMAQKHIHGPLMALFHCVRKRRVPRVILCMDL
jgi:hypothetical protein